jgi:hypothetical protein
MPSTRLKPNSCFIYARLEQILTQHIPCLINPPLFVMGSSR